MGNPLQKILPRRGDKKGKGYWLKLAAVVLVAAAWASLLFDIPVRFPRIWFPTTAVIIVYCGVLHLLSERREHAIEFLYAIAILSAGAIHVSGLPWLQLAYFPFIIALTPFYRLQVIIPLSILVPFTELKTLVITRENIAWQGAFSLFLILTSAAASLIHAMLRRERERAVAELEKIREGARDRTRDTEMESLGSDEIISHYFASRMRADEEIQVILAAIEHAVFADGVHFFEHRGETFSLRCTTEDQGKLIITGRGIMAQVLRERKTFTSGEIDEKTTPVGYIRDRIQSLIVMPVLEGATPVGLLAIDSPRYHAFGENERKTAEMFSAQIAKILERERVYTVLKQDITALRIIKEFSSGLAASIRYDIVLQKLCDYAQQAFRGEAFFFEHTDLGFEVKYFPGEIAGGQKIDFSGTIIELAIDNRHKEYVSDVRQYGLKIFPPQFRPSVSRSVIVVPLFYEGRLLGVFGMISDQREFLDSRQIGLIELMCNQAATSIANARMHEEIEFMATTDGLTGLFNHRILQERLTAELKRSERYATPLSLLLADIDYFKKVNDVYGHPAGDLVLKGMAKILKYEVRDVDIAARYGGEEFAVILPGTDSRGAKNFAERLRKAIMAEVFLADGKTLKVTASIGIATAPADSQTKEDLIEKADQALYHAKHQGRNQSVNWGVGQ
jgi:diguanylate cyclase (GGDEF)-like protein